MSEKSRQLGPEVIPLRNVRRNRRQEFFENQQKKGGLTNEVLLSPEKAAQCLDVGVKFVYERIARGELPAEKVGRLRRIRMSALEAWLLREQEK